MLAHELVYVRWMNTLLMTMTATIAGAISMLANFGFFFGGRSNDSGNIGFVGTLLLLILGPLAAGLVQMAISRTREYAADRAGAEISREPMALASALQKIATAAHRIPRSRPSETPPPAAPLHRQPTVSARAWRLVSTHPNVLRPAWRPSKKMARADERGPSVGPPRLAGPWSAPRASARWTRALVLGSGLKGN